MKSFSIRYNRILTEAIELLFTITREKEEIALLDPMIILFLDGIHRTVFGIQKKEEDFVLKMDSKDIMLSSSLFPENEIFGLIDNVYEAYLTLA